MMARYGFKVTIPLEWIEKAWIAIKVYRGKDLQKPKKELADCIIDPTNRKSFDELPLDGTHTWDGYRIIDRLSDL